MNQFELLQALKDAQEDSYQQQLKDYEEGIKNGIPAYLLHKPEKPDNPFEVAEMSQRRQRDMSGILPRAAFAKSRRR